MPVGQICPDHLVGEVPLAHEICQLETIGWQLQAKAQACLVYG